MSTHLIALAGNPNTGKSTLFNALTGQNQHTGNWPGKTVALFEGIASHKGHELRFVDLPGTYSLRTNSREEEVARDFIVSENPDVTVCVVDATCLERNLGLAFQVLRLSNRVVVCVNLMDEAAELGIAVNVSVLEDELGVPIVPTSARKKEGLEELLDAVIDVADKRGETREPSPCSADVLTDEDVEAIFQRAEEIANKAVSRKDAAADGAPSRPSLAGRTLTERLDHILTSGRFGIPIMLLLLGCVFAITVSLANYPSAILSSALFWLESKITALMLGLGAPAWLHGILIHGCYRTVAWVVSVMLPPMAIFFPLFTLLEDFGYLPRVAFNLDHLFRKSGGHGKQALTMSMGFGCNAAGVVAARIIESPRERMVAILTNSFAPCNGRFPTLITLAAIFFGGTGFAGSFTPGLAVMGVVAIGVGATLAVSWGLTKTLLKGIPSSFVLELPPYRKPEIWKVIARSWKDRTVWVLQRAVVVALPCGAITWLLANVTIGGASVAGGTSLISAMAEFFNPFARLIGLDGVILLAFILGFPANEIVIPLALMSYMASGVMTEVESIDVIGSILRNNGWTWVTGVSAMLFSLLHFPCGTTVYTVYKETGSKKWAALSFIIPTVAAVAVLLVLNTVLRFVGIGAV